ncbi:3-oxoacyl-ACP synthase III family protein [Mucilaginibacter sp.]
MAFLHIKNVAIRGISACVPTRVEENIDIDDIPTLDIEKLIKTTGVERRRIASPGTCTSDMCVVAAEKLIADLKWNKDEIDGLIMVTQSPDYLVPATSPSLQHRLSLSQECFTIDISLGCSGYIYGLSTLGSYMNTGMIKKALLCAGDVSSISCSKQDKSTYPLFGDAGTVTALEYCEGDEGMKFHLASDGSGYKAIMIPDGGHRSRFSEASLVEHVINQGISRNNIELWLDGMDVFSFGISKAPETVNKLLTNFLIDKSAVNHFFFHQANLMMNERIRKKLHLHENVVPYSLKDFGNTSSASIPLTMITETANELKNGKKNIVACGFGVGLSWATMQCTTDHLVIPDLIYYG